jgi:hypothetical protein
MGAFGRAGSQIAETLFDALSDKLTSAAAKSESKKAAKSLIEGKKLNKKALDAANKLPTKAGDNVSKAQAARNKKIQSMVQQSNVESAKETGRREIDVDPDTGRPTSKHIAPWDQGSKGFKKVSKKRKRQLISMGFARVDKNGKLRSTKKWADSSDSVRDALNIKGDSYSDAQMRALTNKGGFQMKKGGGLVVPPNPGAAALPKKVRNKMGFLKKGGSISKRKAGGKIVKRAIGGGVALRGHGAVRKV